MSGPGGAAVQFAGTLRLEPGQQQTLPVGDVAQPPGDIEGEVAGFEPDHLVLRDA